MKNIVKKTLVSGGMLVLASSLLAGCGGSSNKFVIKVWNFKGGFGDTWINNAVAEYEALHAKDSYGGKTGVKFEILNEKKPMEAKDIYSEDMYFVESGNYADYVASGVVADISKALTGENPYEKGKTIISKLTDSQKAFYAKNDGKYYAIPHYTGTYGLTYDAKLFQENGYFFKKGHPEAGKAIDISQYFTNDLTNLAPGPDGKTGVIDGVDYSADDGLPETFDEFYILCNRISLDPIYPLEFTGDSNKDGYITSFASSLMNTLQGSEQGLLNYSFTGDAKELIQTDESGALKFDTDGNPIMEASPVTVADGTGYETFRSKGRFNTLKFIANIFQNQRYSPKCNNSEHTYTTAQQEFVMGEMLGGKAGSTVNRTAMLIDGSWWESEALATFDKMAKKFPNDKQGVMDRQFKFMPLPKANASDTYHHAYVDALNAIQVVNSRASAQAQEICIDFLQFLNTDEQLAKFSQVTHTFRALKYSLTEEQLSSVSPYAKSLYAYMSHPECEMIYPISSAKTFVNGMSAYFKISENFRSKDYKYVTNWFKDTYDPKTMLNGIYSFYKNEWNSIHA